MSAPGHDTQIQYRSTSKYCDPLEEMASGRIHRQDIDISCLRLLLEIVVQIRCLSVNQGIWTIAGLDETISIQNSKHLSDLIIPHEIAIPRPHELPNGRRWWAKDRISKRFKFRHW